MRYSPPVFGLIFAALLPRYRGVVLRNLRLALGKRSAAVEARDVARVFTTYASCLTEAFLAAADGGVSVKGSSVHDHRFAGALAEGKGVILTTAHTGGWQLAGPVLHAGSRRRAPRGDAARARRQGAGAVRRRARALRHPRHPHRRRPARRAAAARAPAQGRRRRGADGSASHGECAAARSSLRIPCLKSLRGRSGSPR